jgi:hypothetical protein
VRPALVFPEDQANRLLPAAEAEDVTTGGTRGTSVQLGSVDWTYNTPTRFCITVYRCMVTQEGRNRGLEAVSDPFRAASGAG